MSEPADDVVRLAARLGLAVPVADHTRFRDVFTRLLDQAGLVLALAMTLPDVEAASSVPFEP